MIRYNLARFVLINFKNPFENKIKIYYFVLRYNKQHIRVLLTVNGVYIIYYYLPITLIILC